MAAAAPPRPHHGHWQGCRLGKFLGFFYLIGQYPEAVEADFQHYYNLDLLDFYRGRLSLRKAVALTMRLPPGAEVWREMGGPLAWTGEMYVLTAAVHALRVANWQRTEDARNQRNYPEQIEPPQYEHEREQKTATIATQAERFLKRQRIKADMERGVENGSD